jgi:hypothetical protein
MNITSTEGEQRRSHWQVRSVGSTLRISGRQDGEDQQEGEAGLQAPAGPKVHLWLQPVHGAAACSPAGPVDLRQGHMQQRLTGRWA